MLHLIASAPRLNDELIAILTAVLKELDEAKEAKLIEECPDELKPGLETVWSILRGLHVLLCPDVSGLWVFKKGLGVVAICFSRAHWTLMNDFDKDVESLVFIGSDSRPLH